MTRTATNLCALLLSLAYLTFAKILIRTTTSSMDGKTSSLNDWVPLSEYWSLITTNTISTPGSNKAPDLDEFECYHNFDTQGNRNGLELISRIEVAVELSLNVEYNVYELEDADDYDVDGIILWRNSIHRCAQTVGNVVAKVDSHQCPQDVGSVSADVDIEFAEWGEDDEQELFGLQYLDNDRNRPIQVQYMKFSPPVKLQTFRVLVGHQRVLTQELYKQVVKTYADFTAGTKKASIRPGGAVTANKAEDKGNPIIDVAKELGYDQRRPSLADKILNT